jgi:hypothetical protein
VKKITLIQVLGLVLIILAFTSNNYAQCAEKIYYYAVTLNVVRIDGTNPDDHIVFFSNIVEAKYNYTRSIKDSDVDFFNQIISQAMVALNGTHFDNEDKKDKPYYDRINYKIGNNKDVNSPDRAVFGDRYQMNVIDVLEPIKDAWGPRKTSTFMFSFNYQPYNK